jgi:hypothetical protein
MRVGLVEDTPGRRLRCGGGSRGNLRRASNRRVISRGEWIQGATLRSTTNVRRKALSKEELSNKSTS